jgi:cytoskeletal protein CcmA (bactofilin family)
MFGSKKKSTGIRQTKFATLIAHDVTLSGNLVFSEGLRLDGHVQGDIRGKAGSQTLLVLSQLGSITGNVHGHDVVINGKIVGDVVAEHFVELQAAAHVTGNIEYRQLRMEAGATVDGKLTRRDVIVAATTANSAAAATAASSNPAGGSKG